MSKIYFYDTNALITGQDKIFNEYFYISSISIKELEKIKISGTEDDSTKMSVRGIIRLLRYNTNKYKVIFPHQKGSKTHDELIIDCYLQAKVDHPDLVFCTNDLGCAIVANQIYNIPWSSIEEYDAEDSYAGFKTENYVSDNILA